MHLHRLVYYSKFDVGSRGNALAADLKRILNSAIRSNSERGITGGLIFNRQFFGQALEGEHAAVMQTFSRIYGDPRHKDIVVAMREPISERLFGAWSMGFAGNSDLFKELCAECGQPDGFNPAGMSGSDLLAFILLLVTKEERFISSQTIAETSAGA